MNGLSSLIKSKAIEFGFDTCGIAPSGLLEEDRDHYKLWVQEGNHAEMRYMEKYADIRPYPKKLLEDAHSVISVLLNYYPGEQQSQNNVKIAKYAMGKDYHIVVKQKLSQLMQCIKDLTGTSDARTFVDTAPVFEKRWAQKSGLGWIGKNTCLINKKNGSFFFIGEILTSLELEYDTPEKERCGNCNKCIEACPTGALSEPYSLDARKCISYLTIEHKGEFGPETPSDFKNFIFGCDICQDVCPWNRFSKPHDKSELIISGGPGSLSDEEWFNIKPSEFSKTAKNSAIKRAGYKNICRNLKHNFPGSVSF
jgi:epoxyqueuosine reductase